MRQARLPLLQAFFLIAISLASSAFAVVGSFSIVSTSFADPFNITEATQMSFASVISNTASTYTLSTSDSVSATGNGAVALGTPASGDYNITDGSGSAVIDIAISGLTANNGVTPQNPVCSYNGGPDVAGCALNSQANPGAGGLILTVGMQAVVDGTQNNGATATPTFDISVTYH